MYKKVLVISAVVVAAVCAAGGGVLLVHNRSRTPAPTIVEQKKNAPEQSAASAAENNKPSQDIPVSPDLSVSQVQASQTGGTVTASAHIGGVSGVSGYCVFTFANSLAKPVVRQVNSQQSGPALTCSTSNIPSAEFSVLGGWTLTVSYYHDDVRAVGTGSINIQ